MAGGSLEEQLAGAVATIEALGAANEALRDELAALKSLLGADSSTTSKPPSGDPVATRKKRAERRAGERAARRAQGRRPGAAGGSLERRRPGRRIEHEAPACSCCGADRSDAPVVGTELRQVIDLPRVTPTVTDHIVYRRRCACGTVTAGEMPPEAKAPVCWAPEVRAFALYLLDRQHLPVERTAELLGDVLGAPVSTGWLCNLQAEAAGKLAPFLAEIKGRLAGEPVICADATGTRVGTAKQWVHTVTTGLLTLLVVHPRRGVEAMRDIGIFDHHHGTIVHDGLAAYDTYSAGGHAQRGAHLLRHLDDVGQTPAFSAWTRQMAGILCAARDASAAAADTGLGSVPADIAARITAEFRATLEVAFALLPAGTPPRRRHRSGWNHAQRKAFNLANRLRTGEDQVLRLLTDTQVPFTNNTAERSLRMVKISVIHDKISGTFQSAQGAARFAAVRSYLQTADAHGHNLLDACRQLFTTGPWITPRSPHHLTSPAQVNRGSERLQSRGGARP